MTMMSHRRTPPDFDEWLMNKGIDRTKQHPESETLLIILEGLYDLILEIQRESKE